jgi:hypothetical protein
MFRGVLRSIQRRVDQSVDEEIARGRFVDRTVTLADRSAMARLEARFITIPPVFPPAFATLVVVALFL